MNYPFKKLQIPHFVGCNQAARDKYCNLRLCIAHRYARIVPREYVCITIGIGILSHENGGNWAESAVRRNGQPKCKYPGKRKWIAPGPLLARDRPFSGDFYKFLIDEQIRTVHQWYALRTYIRHAETNANKFFFFFPFCSISSEPKMF